MVSAAKTNGRWPFSNGANEKSLGIWEVWEENWERRLGTMEESIGNVETRRCENGKVEKAIEKDETREYGNK